MLLKFAVQNFRGFKDRIELDLSHPNHYDFNTYAVKNGIVKNGIIYGPNGSGKSNFGLAIFDIVNHLSQKVKKRDYYYNFSYAGNPFGLVKFEYTFRFDNQLIEYQYKKNHEAVLVEEAVWVNGELYLKRDTHGLYTGEFTMAEQIKRDFLASERQVSLLSYLWSNYPLAENHVLARLRSFVDTMLWYQCLDCREFIGYDNTPTDNIEEYIIKNDLVGDFAHFLEEVSGQQFHLENSNNQQNPTERPVLMSRYEDSGITARIPFFQIASTGTKALELLFFWMRRAAKASFIFIDEFDAFYHFKLSFAVCQQLFQMPSCQLFLSSHNTYLMTNDLLRPDCHFLLDGGKIKPLVDCTEKELRFAHNIEKLYRGGTFVI